MNVEQGTSNDEVVEIPSTFNIPCLPAGMAGSIVHDSNIAAKNVQALMPMLLIGNL